MGSWGDAEVSGTVQREEEQVEGEDLSRGSKNNEGNG